ncbi:MAG: exodeoxyribonuclease VII small subunit [Tenericutes bacterium]|nr:exodeoxyribonuclease VII small subunit [Mycoplasmatota bacterium]
MEQKFEDKIKALEAIVEKLENGEVGLDESIEEYTKAMNLVKECDEKLKNIEEQVNKMIVDGKEEDFEIPEN